MPPPTSMPWWEVDLSVGLASAVVGYACFMFASWALRHRPDLLHGRPRCGRVAKHGRSKGRPVQHVEEEEKVGNDDRQWPRHETFTVQHLSHRGSVSEGHLENTIPAFKQAVKAGTELIELDVWLTRDEEVVCFHDHSLDRLCGVPGRLPEVDYADLPPLRHGEVGSSKTVAIPRLEEVLDHIPLATTVIVEFKHDHPLLVEKVHTLLRRRGKLPYTVWYSLNHRIHARLWHYNPSLPRITSIRSMARLAALYHSGLLPFLPHRWAFHEDIYLAFYMELTYEHVVKDWSPMPDWQRRLVVWTMSGKPCRLLVPDGLIAHLRRRGVPTWLVGVNSEEDLAAAAALGVTGAMTDKPAWLASKQQEGRLPLPALPLS